jgi:hypothetical protein
LVIAAPEPEDFQRVLTEQNPWQRFGEVPPALAPPVERHLAHVLWKRLVPNGLRRFQLILGPRRVGKTTVLYQSVRRLLAQGIEPRRIWWMRVDHPFLRTANLGDLVREVVGSTGATADQPAYVMLDEVAYSADWDLWLKTFYDDHWPVQVAATSSATVVLRNRRMESGVGRWEEQFLMPYSFGEFLELVRGEDHGLTFPRPGATLGETLRALPAGRHIDQHLGADRLALMLVGGFPGLLTLLDAQPRGPSDTRGGSIGEGNIQRAKRMSRIWEMWGEWPALADVLFSAQRVLRQDAVERAVYKDIPQSFGVQDPSRLERLLYVLAGQVTGLLSPRRIGRDLGLTHPTLDRYLSYLESAFLVFTLPNYSSSEATVQRRGRKVYFVDGAVRNAVLQRGLGPLEDPAEQGLLLENLVVSELHKLALHTGVRLYHWRERDSEVDVIYDHPSDPLAFEIASSSGHTREGLRNLARRHERFRGKCYLVAPQVPVRHPDRSEDDVGTLPLETFLLAVGAQAQLALNRTFGAA